MEQIYFDEIHKKQADTKSILIKMLIVLACMVLCPVLFLLGGQLGLLLVAAVIYGAYFLFQRLNKEFEYIYTNGEVDIDVIFGRTSRKRLITIKANQVEVMAKTENGFERYRKNPAFRFLDASSGDWEDAYYAVVNTDGQKMLVLFSPSNRLVDNLKFYLKDRFVEQG